MSTHAGLLLRGGRVAVGSRLPEALDIAIDGDGRISRLGPALPDGGERVIDVAGRLVTPGLVDMHQHLDKSLTAREAPNPSGTLAGAVEAFGRYAATRPRAEIVRRALAAVETCVPRGTVAIRTHVNVDLEARLTGIEALLEVRERCRDRLRLDIVAFVTSSAIRGDLCEARALLEAALDSGADTVGGTPDFAEDPEAALSMLLDVAARRGRRVDLHLDEHLERRCLLPALAARTRELGLEGRVVASHCCSLSALDDAAARRAIAAAAQSGIGVATLPATNLFLQARNRFQPPRGLTRIAELLDAGIPVATASDNIRDPFLPVGSGDLLETARWTILAGQLAAPPARAFAMITATPAQLMGLDGYGVQEGAWADLLISDAEDLDDLVSRGPPDRTVLFHGRVAAGRLPGPRS